MKGHLISFEGGEGGGKSTQIRRLAERLRSELGVEVRLSREPGGTHTGEVIRNILQHNAGGEPLADASEVFLFCASRAQLCARVLGPAIDRGEWVLCDRFTDSTLAYQGFGRGFDVSMLRQFNAFATGAVTPTLTILLDLPVELGMSRVRSRTADGSRDRIESEAVAFHQRLREGYLAIAREEPGRFAVIDASRTPREVEDAIWRVIKTRVLKAVQASNEGERK